MHWEHFREGYGMLVRTAVLCAALAAASAPALANTPTLRLIQPPPPLITMSASQQSGDLDRQMAATRDGWIYQQIAGGWEGGRSGQGFAGGQRPVHTTLYLGDRHPVTMTICAAEKPLRIISRNNGNSIQQIGASQCVTVTSDWIQVTTRPGNVGAEETGLARLRFRIDAAFQTP